MSPIDVIRTISRPIAYHPALAKHVGGVTTAIFLGQLMYWDERSEDELGIYKTSDEWEAETGLSYREQAGARKKLRDLGLLIETEQRLKHRIYYKLDRDAFNAFFETIGQEKSVKSANDDTAIPERRKRNSGATKAQPAGEQKRNPSNDENATRYIDIDYTKTTTEITTEISCDSSHSSSGYTKAFEQFWLSYPNTNRRVAKAKCLAVWKRKKLEALATEIIEHVRAMAKTKQWMDGYEPAPLTYLNQDRWEDGLPEPERITTPSGGHAGAGMNKQEALEARNREIARQALMGV